MPRRQQSATVVLMISQPKSALARALAHLDHALAIAEEHDPDDSSIGDLKQELMLARGALNFAGNSQTKLIEAGEAIIHAANNETIIAGKHKRTAGEMLISTMHEAITHASGPGID